MLDSLSWYAAMYRAPLGSSTHRGLRLHSLTRTHAHVRDAHPGPWASSARGQGR